MNSIRILLNAAVDYAGLFPPARMSMADAVRDYVSSRRSEHSWALGRFTVPVSRLEEFVEITADLLPGDPSGTVWHLSAIAGQDIASDIERVLSFNCGHSVEGDPGAALVEAIELRGQNAGEIYCAAGIASQGLETYLEIPSGGDAAALIASIARAGVRAKVRTGGLTQELIPSPAELAQFISLCVQNGISFKATAGLHHPFRSVHPLSHDPESGSGLMHGFLNVLLAAAFARSGADAGMLADLLGDEETGAFRFDDQGASWRGQRLTSYQLLDARQQCMISFGSCSFHEPMDDLRTFNLL